MLSAMRAMGKPTEALKDQRVLVAGAGSAGLGVAAMLVQGMVQQGLTTEEATANFYICDKDGLVGAHRPNLASLGPAAAAFARRDATGLPDAPVRDGMTLEEVNECLKKQEAGVARERKRWRGREETLHGKTRGAWRANAACCARSSFSLPALCVCSPLSFFFLGAGLGSRWSIDQHAPFF